MGASRDRLGGPRGLVRVRRMEAGLTQEQLAELSGLSVRTISDIERGTTARPRQSSIALLRGALDAAAPNAAGPGHDAASGHGAVASPGAAIVPRQLPPAPRGFVGREAELRALTDLAGRQQAAGGAVVIAALAGMAGVGKTALALRWAHGVAADFPDGQLFVNLRGYDPDQPVAAGDALAGFLRALGVPSRDVPAEDDERAALYRSLLAARRMLVVLDNVGSQEQVRPLLPGASTCAVVMTSRDSLAGLVAREGVARLDLDLLPPGEAVELLRALLRERVDADPGAAGELAGQCSRLPLALRVAAELAVARPAVPLAALVTELADEQRRLDLLDAGGDPRTGVRAVFSWSYRQLSAGSARAFRLLGLHPGPDFDPCAAAALTGGTAAEAARLLGLLARAHLVQQAASGRYGLHDLLRDYARELTAAQDTAQQRRDALTRLFDYYLRTAAGAMDAVFPADRHHRPRIASPAASAAPRWPDPGTARTWLDTERGGLVAAVAYTAGHGWPGHAVGLAGTLFHYFDVGAYYPEALTVHTCARAAARRVGDRAAEASALISLGQVDMQQGRYRQAVRYHHQGLAVYRELADRIGEARTVNNLGLIAYRHGRYTEAVDYFEQAFALSEDCDPLIGAHTLNNRGLTVLRLGQVRQAAGLFGRALACYQEAKEIGGVASTLNNLAVTALRLGHSRRAARLLDRALASFRQLGDRTGEAEALSNIADLDVRQGRCQQAAGRLQQALARYREIGDRPGQAEALNSLGSVFLVTDRPADARIQHSLALSLARKIGDRYEQARAHDGLARCLHAAGAHEQGRQHWQQALTLYAGLGVPEADEVRALLAAA